jgi:hypothetical protein
MVSQIYNKAFYDSDASNLLVQSPAPTTDGLNEMTGISIPAIVGPQPTNDYSAGDLLSLNLDCINDAWLNQFLPDLDLPEIYPAIC